MSTRTLRRSMPLLSSLLLALAAAAPIDRSPAAATPVRGEYVEARTASVFAGACHYNGERVTEGRSAVLAWNIAGGSFNGVDLTGVKVVAAVACEENLAEHAASRRAAIVVDADSDARGAAAVAWIESRCGNELGSVVSVTRKTIAFRHESDAFSVSAAGFATMSVKAMPDHACCTQPELVWYQPLMPITDRRVGYTESAGSQAASVGPVWRRSDENSAIYGTFGS